MPVEHVADLVAERTLVACLADPAFYPHAPAGVEHVQTHISHVFLAGPYVYKLKKRVRFSFLDFGTQELRRHFCEEEVRLNARLAPGIYLGVLPVTRTAAGVLALAGDGEEVASVVWMRRLPRDRTLLRLVEGGTASAAAVVRVAERLAAFHAGLPADAESAAGGAPEILEARVLENLRAVAPSGETGIAPAEHAILVDFVTTFVRRHQTQLRARQDAGRLREGHGDVHAEHVYVLDEGLPAQDGLAALPPDLYVVDCIEFSPRLRRNDVASEVAFLAMDLDRLDRGDLARAFVRAYIAAADDPAIATLLPFYACYRACVRGKVAALKSAEPEVAAAERAAAVELARTYFALALRYAWQVGEPVVIACCGLSGTGKSTLARALADATGFLHLSSDVLRKEADAAPVHYAPAARDAVYARLATEVGLALAAGRSVIADATYLARTHRDALVRRVRAQRRAVVFVECRASTDVVRGRLEARDASATSDARWPVHLEQRAAWRPFGADEPVLTVDTGGALADARAAVLAPLWSWRQGRVAWRAGASCASPM
jgi:hypothetical protein